MQATLRNRTRVSVALAMGVILVASGCGKVGPDYRQPKVEVSQNWIESSPSVSAKQEQTRKWWSSFNDPTLDKLVQMAYEQNLSLRIAGVRVLEARAGRGVAAGAFWPQLQQITAAYQRVQLSEQLSTGGTPPLPKRRFDVNQMGFEAAWEVDLWGKFRRNIESADANVLASVYAYEDVLVALVADVAAAYVDMRSFEDRVRLAEKNAKIQEDTFKTTESKFKNGAVTELDVQEAKANLTNTRAFIPVLKNGSQTAQNRLCILLGKPAQDLSEILKGEVAVPAPPPEVVIGIPADLLRRRPDVRNAERLAAAQSAQIGVAFADLLPQISLRGDIGVSANQADDLWKGSAVESSFGPTFRWSILNYGRIRNNVRVQDARLEALLLNYQNTVLLASVEAENGISSFIRTREQVNELTESAKAAGRSVELAKTQYKQGAIDFTRLSQVETFLVRQEDNLAAAKRDLARSLIFLHKALGGGWELRLGNEFVPNDTIKRMRKRTNWGNIVKPDYKTKSDYLWGHPKDPRSQEETGSEQKAPAEKADAGADKQAPESKKPTEVAEKGPPAEVTNAK